MTNEACPEGWHLPTGDEIVQLSLNLGVWTTAGGRLKETGTAHWNIPNTDAMNLYGFNALPGGLMLNNSFYGQSNYGFWWVVQEIDSPFPNQIHSFSLSHDNGYLNNSLYGGYQKDDAFCIRCLKD